MAITFPRSLPTKPGIKSFRFRPVFNNTVFTSPVTKTRQVLRRPGNLWSGFYEFAPKKTEEVREMKAWIASMEGEFGTFLGFDPTGRLPSGIANVGSDTPLVDGAGQTGSSLNTKGWRNNGTDLLLPGDYFQIGSTGIAIQLKQAIESASSNGTGLATLNFKTPLHASPADNAPIIFDNPVGVFNLINAEDIGWEANVDEFHRFAFAFVEVPQV